MKTLSQEMRACIENCQRCHFVCLSMATTHCLETGGAHVNPEHFRLILDCAQICATSADFMLRGSSHHPHICAECAEICEQCAQSCATLGDMDDCVEACRACAQSCRAMASDK